MDRVGGVTTEREGIDGHRDHVAEHQQPQQETGELRVALLAQVVERSSGTTGTRGHAGPRARGDDREERAEREAREGEMAGELDRDAQHAEDPAADHPADGHRGRVRNVQEPVVTTDVGRSRMIRPASVRHPVIVAQRLRCRVLLRRRVDQIGFGW